MASSTYEPDQPTPLDLFLELEAFTHQLSALDLCPRCFNEIYQWAHQDIESHRTCDICHEQGHSAPFCTAHTSPLLAGRLQYPASHPSRLRHHFINHICSDCYAKFHQRALEVLGEDTNNTQSPTTTTTTTACPAHVHQCDNEIHQRATEIIAEHEASSTTCCPASIPISDRLRYPATHPSRLQYSPAVPRSSRRSAAPQVDQRQ